MILADSNIIIYAANGSHPEMADFVQRESPAFSVVSRVETLGFHRIAELEKRRLERFFSAARVLPVDEAVIAEATRLRQTRKMSLGDALIAGTALANGCALATRNVVDFAWISGLRVIDPLARTK